MTKGFLLRSFQARFQTLAFDVQRDHKRKTTVAYGLTWILGDFVTDMVFFISLAGKSCKNDINFIYSNNTWMQLHSLTPLRLKTLWEVFVGVCVCVCVLNGTYFGTLGDSDKFCRIPFGIDSAKNMFNKTMPIITESHNQVTLSASPL